MDELRRLLDAARCRVNGEWYKLFLIGIYTGLRLGDCCRLDWSQISIAQGVIQLVPAKTRRHHQRMVTIPVHPALGAALVGDGARSSFLTSGQETASPLGEGKHLCSPSPLAFPSLTGPVLPTVFRKALRKALTLR